MKRIIPLILSVVLAITLIGSVSAFAADYDDEYVYELTTPGLNVQSAGTMSLDSFTYADDGYGVFDTNDVSDPWFVMFIDDVPTDTYKYVAVKYAAESIFEGPMWITGSGESQPLDWGIEGCYASHNLTADGEWHLAIYDIAATFSAVDTGSSLASFRLPGAANVGDAIYIAYIGFFKTEAEVKAFDADYSDEYDLPSEFAAESKDPTDTDEPTDEPADEPTDEPTDEHKDDPTPTPTPAPTATSTPKPAATPATKPTEAPAEDNGGNMTWIIVSVAAVVVAAIVVVVILVMKKKKTNK